MADKASQTLKSPSPPVPSARFGSRPARAGIRELRSHRMKAEIVPPANATDRRPATCASSCGQGPFPSTRRGRGFRGRSNVAVKGKASHSSQYMAPGGARHRRRHRTAIMRRAPCRTRTRRTIPGGRSRSGRRDAGDRIVVWNRTDGGTAIRLERFSVIALDEKRAPVWKQQTIPAQRTRPNSPSAAPSR